MCEREHAEILPQTSTKSRPIASVRTTCESQICQDDIIDSDVLTHQGLRCGPGVSTASVLALIVAGYQELIQKTSTLPPGVRTASVRTTLDQCRASDVVLTLASMCPSELMVKCTKSARTTTSKWDPYGTCARKVVAHKLSENHSRVSALFCPPSSTLQASGKTHNHSRVAARPQRASASEAVVVIYI